MIRILMVDDHPAVREGLALLAASAGAEVCGEAAAHAEALACVEAQHPDLAVVDLSLDGEDGLQVVADLKTRGVRCLVYSMHNDGTRVQAAFMMGALGYVSKSEPKGVLMEAIGTVAAGRRFVSPRAAIALTERLGEAGALGNTIAALSAQEREVYRMMGRGEGTYEIATAMRISTHTVESYYARLQQKLGVEGMYRLRRHAIEHLRHEQP